MFWFWTCIIEESKFCRSAKENTVALLISSSASGIPAGGKATIVELDMHDYEAIPRLAAAINERWGKLDGLVANAATLGPLTPLSHLDELVWNDTIAVNLTAQWHLIKAMEPLLLAASAGRAVLVSSGVADGINPFWGPYAISKAGL